MASAGARAYNGGVGAEPLAGSWGKAPGHGVRGQSPRSRRGFGVWTSDHSDESGKFALFSVYLCF